MNDINPIETQHRFHKLQVYRSWLSVTQSYGTNALPSATTSVESGFYEYEVATGENEISLAADLFQARIRAGELKSGYTKYNFDHHHDKWKKHLLNRSLYDDLGWTALRNLFPRQASDLQGRARQALGNMEKRRKLGGAEDVFVE